MTTNPPGATTDYASDAPVLRVNAFGNVSRSSVAQTLGTSHEGDRQRWDPLGYPGYSELSLAHYWGKYERQDIARTIVDKPARDTWQEPPEIHDKAETASDEDVDTPFERAVSKLLDGDATRKGLTHRLFTADRLSRLGTFSTLFIGYSGVDDLQAAVEDNSKDGLDDILYFATYDESRAEFTRVADLSNDRHGLPELYDIEVDEDTTQTVHHSRIIHVAEDTLDDDLHGTPALKPGWNRLEDLEKLLGGGAEMYWRGAYPGIVVKQDPQFQMADGGDGIAEQIKEYRHGMRRALFPVAQEVDVLSSQVEDPGDQIDDQVSMLSSYCRIPRNMLVGNETGERATTEDRSTYHEFIASRRRNFAEPEILRPLLDKLVAAGVLPEPEGDGYEIEWPPLEEQSEADEADVALTKAKAVKSVTGGNPTMLGTIAEFRNQFLEWDSERGSMAEESDGAEPMAPIDEDNPEVQDQFDQQQEAAADGGQPTESNSDDN